jgi:hypothetical protein
MNHATPRYIVSGSARSRNTHCAIEALAVADCPLGEHAEAIGKKDGVCLICLFSLHPRRILVSVPSFAASFFLQLDWFLVGTFNSCRSFDLVCLDARSRTISISTLGKDTRRDTVGYRCLEVRNIELLHTMAVNWVFALRGVQAVLSVGVLGLMAYGSSYAPSSSHHLLTQSIQYRHGGPVTGVNPHHLK